MTEIGSVLAALLVTLAGYQMLGALASADDRRLSDGANDRFPDVSGSSVLRRRARCYLTGLLVSDCDCADHGGRVQ